jgi:hypothetical protein
MAGRLGVWQMSGGETLPLAQSLRGDMEAADTLTGETPVVEVHQKQGNGAYTDVTAANNFVVASVSVNTAELTDHNGNPIAVGDGVQFKLTAGDVGRYKVRIECPSSDGHRPVAEVVLVVGDTV